jgi:PucR family transcriptional regulator, proline-responsive transcriptional activator
MLDQNKLDQVVDEVARITGRNVSLDDVFSRVLAYNTSHPTTDRARIESVLMKSVSAEAKVREEEFHLASQTRPFVLPANPELGFLARVCIPLVFQGLKAGYLWILVRDEDDPAEPILDAVVGLGDRIEHFAYTVLEAIEPATQESVAREKILLDAMTRVRHSAPEWLKSAVAEGPVRVAVLTHPSFADLAGTGTGQQGTVLRQGIAEASRATHSRLLWATGDGFVAALFGPGIGPLELATIVKRFGQSVALHSLKSGSTASPEVAVGLSRPAEDLARLPESFREAMVALQAGIVDATLTQPVGYDSVGVYQYLAQRDDQPDSTRFSALLAASKSKDLVDLLERVYDSNGPRNDLAAELHIHRTSVYHRLRRVGKIIGDDPLSSNVRLDLHLAIKARRWAARPRFESSAEE